MMSLFSKCVAALNKAFESPWGEEIHRDLRSHLNLQHFSLLEKDLTNPWVALQYPIGLKVNPSLVHELRMHLLALASIEAVSFHF